MRNRQSAAVVVASVHQSSMESEELVLRRIRVVLMMENSQCFHKIGRQARTFAKTSIKYRIEQQRRNQNLQIIAYCGEIQLQILDGEFGVESRTAEESYSTGTG